MKKLSFSSILSALLFGTFLLFSQNTFAKKIEKKTVWTFTNSTGEAANDLHMEMQAGCLPTNIITDAAGIKRAGGIFTDFPNQGSPSHHDYKGGEVEDGGSITLQFDTKTKPKKWWWTKDGDRIGDIEYADSEDLTTASFQPVIPEYLDYTVEGTNQTTGDVAIITVYNPTAKPVTVTIPVCFVPSDGNNQSYVITIEVTFTVGINQKVSVPLQGYCADIYKPAVPQGVKMPDISEWIFEDEDYLASIPMSEITGTPLSPETSGGITPTIPGTEIPITKAINQFDNPELFAQLSIAAFKNLEESCDELRNELIADKQSTIQQGGWIYTAALTGNFYKVEHLMENAKKQYEANTGEKFEKAAPEDQHELEQSVKTVHISFKLIGEHAKVLNVADTKDVDPDDVDDPSDLPTHIKNMYNRYAIERQMGNNHQTALETAVRAAGLRARWGATFRRLYGR